MLNDFRERVKANVSMLPIKVLDIAFLNGPLMAKRYARFNRRTAVETASGDKG